jgi:hypothetical protein
LAQLLHYHPLVNPLLAPARITGTVNLVISSVVHQVHVGTLSGNTDKKVEEKIGANGRQNGNQEIIMHSMSTPALSPNGSLLSHKVSSISKKVKDALGKVIPGNAVLTR